MQTAKSKRVGNVNGTANDLSPGAAWYIVPQCGDSNKKRGRTLELYLETTLVAANAREKCG